MLRLFSLILLTLTSLQLAGRAAADSLLSDTVYLAPDTVVLERVVYVEYSGTPERYWSLSAGALGGKCLYTGGEPSLARGATVLLMRNEGRWGMGIGAAGAWTQRDFSQQHIRYIPLERTEMYEEVLDSFGKIQGADTLWTTLTRSAERQVLDSAQDAYITAESIGYHRISIPLQLGYEFKSGFLFARAYMLLQPAMLRTSSGDEFVISAGAGIQASYLLHPRWAVWWAAQYQADLTEEEITGGRSRSAELLMGISYLWGGQ